MRISFWLAALVLIAHSASAAAQPAWPEGWYVGTGVASTRATGAGAYGRGNAADSSSGDTGVVLTGGYRWSRHLAFEIGYGGGSEPGFSTTATAVCADPGPCRVDVDQATSAFDASVVAIMPLARIWELYLKGGGAVWSAESDQVITSLDPGLSIRRRVEEDGLAFMLGAGGGVMLGEHAYLRLDYEAFRTEDELLAIDRNALFEQFALEFHWRFR